MTLELLEVSAPSIAYICLGGFIVAFSMVSLLVREKLYINEVVLGTVFGIAIGPYGAGIFDPRGWGHHSNTVTLEVMRIVLATGLFAIGVELPQSYMAKHAKGLAAMVVPTMAIGWVTVSGLLKALFPQLNFISCLAIAACLTPTDPIISAAIVGGKWANKHVPLHLRRIISAESAANDGLAFPFLTISLYLTTEASTGKAFVLWIIVGWLYQVILGIILGATLGIVFSYLIKFSHRKGYIDHESYLAQYLALAILTIGIASTLGSDDLLAAFAAGSAISWDGEFNVHTENETFAAILELLLNCGCFVYIGAWLPFSDFSNPTLGIDPWRLAVLFIGILFLRRIPSILMLYRWVPEIKNWREAIFTGHFGPMGVGAIFVSALALHKLPHADNVLEPQTQAELLAVVLQPIVSFTVLGSIIIHGLSIPFFSFSRNISRTLSLTATVVGGRPRTIDQPEWVLGIKRPSSPSVVELANRPTDACTSSVDVAPGASPGERDRAIRFPAISE